MGADGVSLFDKRLCDEIISLAPANMPAFVEAHLASLHDLSEFKCGFAQDVPANVRLTQLREQGRRDEELKADLADHLCVSSNRLTVDYWGCYAEVFSSGEPPGSIPDYTLFLRIKQQGYLLLRSEHVERMLASLETSAGVARHARTATRTAASLENSVHRRPRPDGRVLLPRLVGVTSPLHSLTWFR